MKRPGWLASHDELEATDQRDWVAEYHVENIDSLSARRRARVAGVLRAVTFAPVGSATALRAQLFDGTGTVDLCWTGRHDVPGIVPGRRLVAVGMVARGEPGEPRLVMFNPRYELVSRRMSAA